MGGGFEHCLIEEGEAVGVCDHKGLFPLLDLEWAGFGAVFMFTWFACMGGVSGGGIMVPISVFFFKFDSKNAIALSNFSICLGSILRFIMFSSKPHPLKNGKGLLVDQNLAAIMLPMIISGVSFGIILNIMMPELVISALYATLLTYFGFGLFNKGLDLYRKETEQRVERRLELVKMASSVSKEGGAAELRRQPDFVQVSPDVEAAAPKEEKQTTLEKETKLQKLIEAESTNFQWKKLGLNWCMIIMLTVVSLLRGSGNPLESLIGTSRCDDTDWILFMLLQVICVLMTIGGVIVVKKEYSEKVECGYEFAKGDLQATPKNLVVLVIASFFGAMACAFCGIGPAQIFCPFLVMIGTEAQVATATSMYIAMYCTLSATIQLIIFYKINLEYALYINLLTLAGSIPGIFFQQYAVRKTGRVSTQVFFLSAVILVAILSVTTLNIPQILHQRELGENLLKISDYCNV